VIHDESDFHECYEINLSHTRATVADSTDRQLVSVSTVDKPRPDSYFKNHWKDARDGKNGFKALFYGWDVRPDRNQAWYDALVRENDSTPWVVEGNYPRNAEEALSPLSAQSCFNKDILTELWDNSIDPKVVRSYIFTIHPYRVGTSYVAGVDIGEGVGLDYSCLSIVGKYGGQSEVSALIYSNDIKTDWFAQEIYNLCEQYNFPLLGVENNAIGVAVINKLLELNYPNLYYTETSTATKSVNRKPGWTTGENNKKTSILELVNSVDDGSLITRFKPQIQELMEYQWVKGKPIPTGKTHGDTVISLMIANQMLKKVGNPVEASMYLDGVRIF